MRDFMDIEAKLQLAAEYGKKLLNQNSELKTELNSTKLELDSVKTALEGKVITSQDFICENMIAGELFK